MVGAGIRSVLSPETVNAVARAPIVLKHCGARSDVSRVLECAVQVIAGQAGSSTDGCKVARRVLWNAAALWYFGFRPRAISEYVRSYVWSTVREEALMSTVFSVNARLLFAEPLRNEWASYKRAAVPGVTTGTFYLASGWWLDWARWKVFNMARHRVRVDRGKDPIIFREKAVKTVSGVKAGWENDAGGKERAVA